MASSPPKHNLIQSSAYFAAQYRVAFIKEHEELAKSLADTKKQTSFFSIIGNFFGPSNLTINITKPQSNAVKMIVIIKKKEYDNKEIMGCVSELRQKLTTDTRFYSLTIDFQMIKVSNLNDIKDLVSALKVYDGHHMETTTFIYALGHGIANDHNPYPCWVLDDTLLSWEKPFNYMKNSFIFIVDTCNMDNVHLEGKPCVHLSEIDTKILNNFFKSNIRAVLYSAHNGYLAKTGYAFDDQSYLTGFIRCLINCLSSENVVGHDNVNIKQKLSIIKRVYKSNEQDCFIEVYE